MNSTDFSLTVSKPLMFQITTFFSEHLIPLWLQQVQSTTATELCCFYSTKCKRHWEHQHCQILEKVIINTSFCSWIRAKQGLAVPQHAWYCQEKKIKETFLNWEWAWVSFNQFSFSAFQTEHPTWWNSIWFRLSKTATTHSSSSLQLMKNLLK